MGELKDSPDFLGLGKIMTDVEILNQYLKAHGVNDFGQPLYRVVWSDFQLEHRRGVFRDFIGKIFLREFVGVREVPKYNFVKERWILERWFPPSMAWHPELPDSSQGNYEPFYVFQDRHGNYLEPIKRVCDKLIHRAEHPVHRTEQERINEQMEQEDKQAEEDADYFEISPITNALHMKEAVGYTKEVKEKEKIN
jgi:hypothetical protein